MSKIEVPVVRIGDYLEGGSSQERFVQTMGDSLRDIGFFAVADHDVDQELLKQAYDSAASFFDLPEEIKKTYEPEGVAGQRGYTSLYTEHAKDSEAPDLKEFYQVGRVDVPDDHPVHKRFGPNLWPSEVADFEKSISELYRRLDKLGRVLLEGCARYLGEAPSLLSDMVEGGDTIIRVLHYPPLSVGAPAGAIRAAAHEDINLITLLPGATASGLELQNRKGEWLGVEAAHEHIVCDSGDMLQNLSNGLLRSTTHRVVNPDDSNSRRFSMPCFIHPRRDADLSPRPSSIERSGGTRNFPNINAGEYLDQRLAEIGLS